MDRMKLYRIVQSVKNNGLRFDTHDLEEFDVLLTELGIVRCLQTAERQVLRSDLRPMAEAYQSAEVRHLVAKTPDDLMGW